VTAPFLVTGGTGTLGRLVVPLLRPAGADVRVLSRRPRPPQDGVTYLVGDLSTGAGVAAAAEGVGTVLHLAGGAKGDEDKARTLVAALSGVRHLVFISVVGADRVPVVSGIDRAMFGYYAAQRAAELVVANSGVPWTTLRATQFHDLILTVVRGLARLPVCPVPSGLRAQPVDAAEVAARLVSLAFDEPAGLVPDLAGPEVHGLDDLLRSSCVRSASAGRSCRCGCRARPSGPCGPAPTSPPTTPPATSPGPTSWPPASPPAADLPQSPVSFCMASL
jgi:uncharacterized protein YbjT (DUF2867 family)